ncbi:MAG TPA: hypothetical protein VNE86_00530 [Nitrososphaerales archaeon]|nr:hypothetical protein [Nitrososphaerales archaeon]
MSELGPELKVRFRRRTLAGRKKFCPKCLSELKLASALSGWLVPEYYACSKCGYSGYVAFEEMPQEK